MGKVTIDGKESQESYGLVLTEAVIGQPELETVIISVPGRSGALDCTEKLFGGPVYKNRTITLTFKTRQKLAETTWPELQTKLSSLWHGQTKRIIFDDDPLYFYKGRLDIKSFTVEGPLWTIKVEADCKPHKYLISDPTQKSL